MPHPAERPAKIALEDGTVLSGGACGAEGTAVGEAVFNTSLTGYQEVLTDPSYRGQIVVMTYPLIGNYGIIPEDDESRRPFLAGFVVRECSPVRSNRRSRLLLGDYLRAQGIVGIEGVDTRMLTRRIRVHGAMKAAVSTEELDDRRLVRIARESPGLVGRDLVREVTIPEPTILHPRGRRTVVILDCGAKHNIHRELARRGCRVIAVPADTTAERILAYRPHGVLLSNGPGDPAALPHIVRTVRGLLGRTVVFGICLGHQMLGRALGGGTFKLKFGHHGGNHPVKDLRTGRISITVQNHGFCVDPDTLPRGQVEVTHINLNDRTLEGMRHRRLPAFSVQYHPEAAPGPHDAQSLFDEFVRMMVEHHA